MSSHNENNYYTELDIQLQALAVNDWATFCKLIGEDARMAAKICMLRSRGFSHTQISIKFSLPRTNARRVAEKCICEPVPENSTPKPINVPLSGT